MHHQRVTPVVFRRATALGLGLILPLVSPSRAETGGGGADYDALRADAGKVFKEQVAPFVKNYCSRCHGSRPKAGINLDSALKDPGSSAAFEHWKKAVASVKVHDMPPEDAAKQPTEEERRQFIGWISKLKYLRPTDPGPFVIRRLSKVEYANTLRDLLGANPAVADILPEEVPGAGYLNSISPLQSELFLEVAGRVIDQALGPVDGKPTKLQKTLLGEPPAKNTDPREAARKVARSFARSAYRRPPSEDEVEVLVKVFNLARENHLAYPAALRLMLKAVLVSPQFLFITPAQAAKPGQAIVPLDDHQLASRLSYFLWSTMPDAELASLADSGKLHEPAVLRAQVKRMLADQRARALFDGFGAQWLGVGGLKDKTFDTAKFPQMTPALRAAMYDEARLFFESIVRENRSVVSFVDGDYTFLNGTLAPLYGLQKTVTGPEMRRVKLTDANRGGILAMPGVLAGTSMPERASAVKRGVWVLEQVLGEHVPAAPGNVPTLETQDRQQVAGLTLRQRTELHRTNPACANCHKLLDPIGFGLENFDAIGRWRDRDDSGGPIDATGELPGGKRFTSPKELKAIIAGRQQELARNLTEKLLAYALCRQLEGYDEIVADQLVERLARDGYRMQSLITEVVTSYPFLNRRVQTTITANAK